MKSLLLISVLTLSACGTYQERTVAPEFKPYVDQFLEMADAAGVSVSLDYLKISFEEFPADDRRGGQCDVRRFPTISINKRAWDTKSEGQKMIIIAHELGHCILGREHVNQGIQVAPDMPLSLMHWSATFHAEDIAREPAHYAWELFHPGDFSRYGKDSGFRWP